MIYFGIAVTLCILWIVIRKNKKELSAHLEELILDVNSTAKTTLINSPFPLVIVEENGNILWKSKRFVNEFEVEEIDIKDVIDRILKEIKEDFKDKTNKGNINKNIVINNNYYTILGSFVKSKNSENHTIVLHFIDETERIESKKILEETQMNIGMIIVDNIEEINQQLSEETKAILISQIEQKIYDWGNKYNALIIKIERERFLVIIEHKNLIKVKEEKVEILDSIKEIKTESSVQPTLSIAFSDEGTTNLEKRESAREVIDIVLGRGGDQCIIKSNGKYEFFGGRTQEVEKRTKVKARMISNSLKDLIEESENVLIMGHNNADMDSLGSALGIYRFAKTLNKPVKIVNETLSAGMEKFIETLKLEEKDENYIINISEAKNIINENTVLVIVDTNKESYVESPELIVKTDKIVIIDHHRRSTDYIDKAILTFHEVYASSAAELVTEIIEYSQIDIKLKQIELEALYAGIMLDTKNFTFKTGVRTFESLAYLKKCGIDIIKIKKWFQSDLENYEKIAEIVSKSEIINENIAISIYDKIDSGANTIAAKAADELLTIGGITASFVLGQTDNIIYISGRSIGDINVQIILEKLGGGGHLTLAGAQLKDITIEEAKQKVISVINEYFLENEE